MIYIKSRTLSLLGCLLIAGWLLVAHVLSNMLLLLSCLVCFFCFVLWASYKGEALPILLFFLPWAPLIKIEPGTTSVYTITLLALFMIFFLFGNKNMSMGYIFLVMALAVLTITVKLCYGYSFSNSYIVFFAFLLVFPMIVREIDGRKYDFYDLTVLFSVSIIIASLTSHELLRFSTISRFIEVHEQLSYSRYAGFYSDPNFYAAHITAAISGIMILIAKTNRIRKRIFLIILLVFLTYCGFLSVSKTFIVVSFCICLFWILQVLFQRGKISTKLFTMLCILTFGFFILSATVFDALLDLAVMRLMGSSGNLLDFTTGRLAIWDNYLAELWKNPLLLFFGKGLTNVLLNARAAHNTFIQMVYQFGLVGTCLFISWFKRYAKIALEGVKIKSETALPIIILLFGTVGPWLSLDMLFFDEIFLLTFYVFAGTRWLSELKEIY